MTLADTTFVKIVTHLKEHKLRIDKYLLDDDHLSDSEESLSTDHTYQRDVNAFVTKYGLADFFQEIYIKF